MQEPIENQRSSGWHRPCKDLKKLFLSIRVLSMGRPVSESAGAWTWQGLKSHVFP